MNRPTRLLGAALALATFAACDDDEILRVPGEPELCVVAEDGSTTQCSRTDLAIDFGAVLIDERREIKLLLKNMGRADYTLTASEYADAPVPDFTIAVARTSLAIGQEHTLAAVFSPRSEGELATTINLLLSDATVATFPVRLTGRGVKGACSIEPGGTVDFGAVATGDAWTGKVTLRNNTDLPWPATIGAITSETDPGAFEFEDFTPGTFTVEARGELEIPITFRPNHLGTHTAFLTVPAPAICQPAVVLLQGNGANQVISWEPRPLDFGFVDIEERVTAELVFKNAGNRPVQLTELAVADTTGVFALDDPSVTTLELPGGGAEVPVRIAFKPTELGPVTSSLTFKSDSSSLATGSAAIRGNGGGPEIEVTPKKVAFGQVGVGSWQVRRVVVANVGSNDPTTDKDNLTLPTTWHEWAPSTGHNFTAELDGYQSSGIQAASSADVRITFTPQNIGPQQAVLRIFSSDPDEPVVEVEVTAEGANIPPCDYSVSPPDLRFGMVDAGKSSTLSFFLNNDGTTPCIVSSLELGRATPSAFSLPNPPAIPATIATGAKLEVPVKFAPTTDDIFDGEVELFVNSINAPQVRVRLSGASKAGCLLIAPDDLAFGVTKVGCSARAKKFTAYNTCTTKVTLNSAALLNGATSKFTVTKKPAMPYTVNPGQSVEFEVSYRPTAVGQDVDSIALQTAELSHPYVATVSGSGAATAIQTDVFAQGSQAKMDILFVIDDSGSMDDKQTSLSQNFSAFMAHAQGNIDYRIAVTSTTVCTSVKCNNLDKSLAPDGRFAPKTPMDSPSPSTRVITNSTPNAATLFSQLVKIGLGGSGTEQPLAAAERALSPSRLGAHNSGFLRPDAYLAIVLVTDTLDQSPNSGSYYLNALLNVVGFHRANEFSISGIIPTPAGPRSGCVYDDKSASMSSTKLIDLINQTGGLYDNICTQNWSTTLEQLSQRIFGNKSRFSLTSAPDISASAQPMRVLVNGTEVPRSTTPGDGGWTLDTLNNTINFDPMNTPEPGDTIAVEYQVACLP